MKKKFTLIVVLTMSVAYMLFFQSCQYKKEDVAYPVTSCDTSNVKYSVEIVSILQTNCYSCHSNANAATLGGGNKLEGYTNLKPYAQFGSLVDAITRTSNTMPKGMAKLSDCNIAKIRTWVKNGYLNN
jgi:cytochrome c553